MNSFRLKAPLVALGAAALLACSLLVAETRADGSGGEVSAAAKALAKAGAAAHGVPYDIESEVLRGSEVWEIKVATGRGGASEVHVSANGARVVDVHRQTGTDKEAFLVARAKVRLAAALRIAARQASGPFDEAELDRGRGRLVWSVTFADGGSSESEIEVDATNGRVVGHGHDD